MRFLFDRQSVWHLQLINMSKAGNADRQPAGHYIRSYRKECGYERMTAYVLYVYLLK